MLHPRILVLLFLAVFFGSAHVCAAEKSSAQPTSSRARAVAEISDLLGHPLPKEIVLVAWDKSKPLTILLRGHVTGLDSTEARSATLTQFVGELHGRPKLLRRELTSVVNDEAGGKLVFEIVLTFKNFAYDRLLQLAANSPEVELTQDTLTGKESVTGIVKLRNKKRGGLIAVDTKTYTAENIGEVLEKIAADNAAAETAADTAQEKADAEERAAQRAGTASTLESNGRKFPSFLPAYPGATGAKTTITALASGMRVYDYYALSRDTQEAITEFYFQKVTAAHFKVNYRGPGGLNTSRTDPPGDVVVQLKTLENGQVSIWLTGVLKEKP